MAKVPHGRRAPHIKAELEVYFDSAREEGPAVLADVSSVGALLEETLSQPRVGTSVSMTVFRPNRTAQLQVVGHVIRHTEAGFAIEFERLNPRVYHLLIEGAASVTSVEESDRADAPMLEEVGGSGSQDEAGVPDEALDIIIDRVQEMLDGDAGRTRG